MFHIISKMEANTTNNIFHELDRTYKTVLDFVHELQDALEEDPEFDFSGVCEVDEVSMVAGEKGIKQASPRYVRVRQAASRDTRPSLSASQKI
jgi:hypothetical protein